MSVEEGLKAMKKFNEKADKLKKLSFTDIIMQNLNRVIVDFSRGNELVMKSIKREGPNEEQIDAFLLTLRFFFYRKDGCSFEVMGDFYNSLPIPQDKRDMLNNLNDGLNEFMAGRALMAFDGQVYTRQEIFDTFMYGELAHERNPKLVERYNKWMEDKFNRFLFESEFIFILSGILRNVFAVEKLNNEVISYLEIRKVEGIA